MSFIEYLALGFFDHSAVKERRMVLRRHWTIREIEQSVQRCGASLLEEEHVSLDGRFIMRFYNGYLMYFGTPIAERDLPFVECFVRETDCDIVDFNLGSIESIEGQRLRCESLKKAMAADHSDKLRAAIEKSHWQLVEESKGRNSAPRQS